MLTLRKMTKEDIPLYLRWLKAPHVAEWVDSEPEKIYRKFDDPIYKELLIACWDGEPIAFVQVYDAAAETGTIPPACSAWIFGSARKILSKRESVRRSFQMSPTV